MYSAADIAVTFVILKPCFIIVVFGVSWVSVKWFSGIGVTALLRCIPCRKGRSSVLPASSVVTRHQSLMGAYPSEPQKTAATNSADSMDTVETQVEAYVPASRERMHTSVRNRHQAVITAMNNGWSGGKHDASEIHARGVDLLEIMH